MPDYTAKTVRYVLTHYLDPVGSHDEGYSPNHGNPNETAYTERADIDRAISSLCKSGYRDIWPEICQLSPELMRARIEEMPPAQRYIVKNCIFGECMGESGYSTPCQYSESEPYISRRFYCKESWAINRMVRFLNGEPMIDAGKERHRIALLRGIDRIIKAMSRATAKARANLTKQK